MDFMYELKKTIVGDDVFIEGYLGFICPHCLEGEVAKGKVVAPIQSGMIKMTCPSCGKDYDCDSYDVIDPNILRTIETLNKKGYTTWSSCEGHENYSGSYIYFKNKDDEEILITNPLPDSWYLSKRMPVEEFNFIIRGKEEISKSDRMEDIENWAQSLPEKKTEKVFNYFYTNFFDKEISN